MVCDYGQILAPATLAAARHGGVNLHASLLPKYRGAAPINWAIYHGETETGVTVIHMTPQIDAGPCIAQARAAIGPDETAADLEPRLAELGARLICETIDRLEAGRVEAIPQDAALAGKAPRLKKTDGLVDWSRPAAAIKNQIRAMEPWPKTYTFWHRPGGPPVRLILGPASVVQPLWCGRPACTGAGETPAPQVIPGTVLEAAGNRLVIAAGEDAVMPAERPARRQAADGHRRVSPRPPRPAGRSVRRREGGGRRAEGGRQRIRRSGLKAFPPSALRPHPFPLAFAVK